MAGLDMKVLEGKENLSENDFKAIEAEVMAEETGQPPAPKPEDTPPTETPEEKEKREKQEKEEADAKVKADAEALKAEEERLLNAKEEDLSEEDKAKRAEFIKAKETKSPEQTEEEKKAAEDKKKQDEEAEKLKQEIDKEISAYALEHKISVEEAHLDFDSREKIREKYKDDPKQLAMANLHLQRLYTRTQEELKVVKETKPIEHAKEITIESVIALIDNGEVKYNGKSVTREQALEYYRKVHPDITENLEDDAVIKLIAKDMKDGFVRQQEIAVANNSAKAKEKRITIIASLPEADKKFSSEIKTVLDNLPDSVIASDKFDLTDTILWAKGKTYDVDIQKAVKEAEERGYKRGIEQAKIIAQKGNPSASGAPQAKVKPKVTVTAEQRKRALSMFEGAEMTEDAKIEAFLEIEAENKK